MANSFNKETIAYRNTTLNKCMKYLILALMITILIFSMLSCKQEIKVYSNQFLDTFDTAIGLTYHTDNSSEFNEAYEYTHKRFRELHRMFDIYNSYDGVINVKTINDNAGRNPVVVPEELYNLIILSLEWNENTNGKFNIAFGSVLKIWHSYRENADKEDDNASIPSIQELEEAVKHTSIDDIVIDSEKKEIYLKDTMLSLDLGAIAKGYAAELVANELVDLGHTNFAINAGGNIIVRGLPLARENDYWIIGIKDPDSEFLENPGNGVIDRIKIDKSSAIVTSGIYQRYFISGGRIYHHIIDPETLFPENYFKSVTVVHEDSSIADLLSTMLMLMPLDEGMAYVENNKDVMAYWVLNDRSIVASRDMEKIIIESEN